MNPVMPGGAKYFALFKDDAFSFQVIYCIKQKSQALECLKKFLNRMQQETGHKIKVLRSDRGGEYTGGEFQKFLEAHGIRQELTYMPEQNGALERENRTIMEAVRSMLHESQVHNRFWGEATNTIVYLLNQTGSKTMGAITPY
jgi:transposase InsO family protein